MVVAAAKPVDEIEQAKARRAPVRVSTASRSSTPGSRYTQPANTLAPSRRAEKTR